MPNLNAGLVSVLCIYACVMPVYGATFCGEISSTYGMLREPGSTQTKACISGTYDYNGPTPTYVQFKNYDYVCVSYSSSTTDQLMHTYLQNCTVQTSTYKCNANRYYSSSGCTACPTGSAAGSSTHTNTSCQYCTDGYYYNAGSCKPCPSYGDNPTTTGGTFYRTDISYCCLANPIGIDETGVFEVDAYNCCYN